MQVNFSPMHRNHGQIPKADLQMQSTYLRQYSVIPTTGCGSTSAIGAFVAERLAILISSDDIDSGKVGRVNDVYGLHA